MSKIIYQVVKKNDMHGFFCSCLEVIGTNQLHARTLADCLILADYRGHYSHGLNRLEIYIKDIKDKLCNKDGAPIILKESVAVAQVDGNNLLGPVVGKFCMDLAIKKAKDVGIGWVVAKGSNHFGIAGFYSLMASKEGMIGISMTNASPLVATTGGKKPFFGTNPLSLAAPGKNDKDFVLDMATSVVSYGKVEIQARKGEQIPPYWAIDSSGHTIEDPAKFNALLPLGGTLETSGYKGYGLAMMIEILCASLSGSHCAPHIRTWHEADTVADLGQCFAAINPQFFDANFSESVTKLVDDVKSQEPAENGTILVAGDPEKIHQEKCDKLGGIPYHPNQIIFAENIAKQLNVKPPKVFTTCED